MPILGLYKEKNCSKKEKKETRLGIKRRGKDYLKNTCPDSS